MQHKTMAQIKKDSKRWDALINSKRIRVLGTAGIGSTGYQHFGIEFYSAYPKYENKVEQDYGIKTLETYVDTIIKGELNENRS